MPDKYIMLAISGDEVNVSTVEGGWQRVADNHYRRNNPSGYTARLFSLTDAQEWKRLAEDNTLNKAYSIIIVPLGDVSRA